MPGLDHLPQANFEGAMVMLPAAGEKEIARWFWGDVAAAWLLRRGGERLSVSADPAWNAAAFGIAR